MTPPTMLISGSHGALRADVLTGFIIERLGSCDCEDCHGLSYADIARIDPVTMAHELQGAPYPATDVLAVGYWTPCGTYVEPLTIRTVTDGGHAMEFDDWVPIRMLPAPSRN